MQLKAFACVVHPSNYAFTDNVARRGGCFASRHAGNGSFTLGFTYSMIRTFRMTRSGSMAWIADIF